MVVEVVGESCVRPFLEVLTVHHRKVAGRSHPDASNQDLERPETMNQKAEAVCRRVCGLRFTAFAGASGLCVRGFGCGSEDTLTSLKRQRRRLCNPVIFTGRS
jgi:hypothetical protein